MKGDKGVTYFLACFWAILCAIGFLSFVRHLINEGDKMESLVLGTTTGVCALILAATPFGVIKYEKSPNLATLKKHEWLCTDSRLLSTGKAVYRQCIEYSRK